MMNHNEKYFRDVYIAPDAKKLISSGDIKEGLARHVRDDWGEIGWLRRLENMNSVKHGGQIISIYRDHKGNRFKVETWRGRLSVLLPR